VRAELRRSTRLLEIMKVAKSTLWAGLVWWTLSTAVFACSCGQQDKTVGSMSPEEQALYVYDKAQIIIRGTVARVDAVKRSTRTYPGSHLRVHLEDTEVIKGDPSLTHFYTGLDDGGCWVPPRYALPMTYYGSLDDEGRVWVLSCFYWEYLQPATHIDAGALWYESKTLPIWRQLRARSQSSPRTDAPAEVRP
jgi:hypothetical protein